MLAIKLKPVGKKKQISYRVVVAEKRSKLKGRFVDDLGWYNPRTKEFKINQDKVTKWLKNGAGPTDTVHNLLVRAGAIPGPKKAVHSTKKKTEEITASPTPSTEGKKIEAKKDEQTSVKDAGKEAPAEQSTETVAPAKEEKSGESESKPEIKENNNQKEKPAEEKPEPVEEKNKEENKESKEKAVAGA